MAALASRRPACQTGPAMPCFAPKLSRRQTLAGLGGTLGTLVLPARLSENWTFRELLAHVKQTTLGAYAHQDVPFEKLVEALSPERSRAHSPLFQVALVLENAPLPLEQQGGLRI